MIRLATIEDIPEIIKMSKSFYDIIVEPFNLGFNDYDLKAYCKFLIANPLSVILLLEYRNKIEGLITGLVSPWIADASKIFVTEQWWWVNPEIRNKVDGYKLIEALVNWSKKFNATHLLVVSVFTENRKILRRFYKQKGFKPLETCFIKEI